MKISSHAVSQIINSPPLIDFFIASILLYLVDKEPFCDSSAKNLCVIQEPRAKIQDRFDLDV